MIFSRFFDKIHICSMFFQVFISKRTFVFAIPSMRKACFSMRGFPSTPTVLGRFWKPLGVLFRTSKHAFQQYPPPETHIFTIFVSKSVFVEFPNKYSLLLDTFLKGAQVVLVEGGSLVYFGGDQSWHFRRKRALCGINIYGKSILPAAGPWTYLYYMYLFIGPIRPRPYKVTFFAKFWRLELEMEFLVFVHIYYLEILLLQKNGSAVAVIFHILPVLFVKVITDT